MHAENSKIQAKIRLMSQIKKLEEIQECTFTPKLCSKQGQESSKNAPNVKLISIRMYEYADKYKQKKETLKEKLEVERGEEIRFTPHIEKSSKNSAIDLLHRKNVYEGLYGDYQKREEDMKK